jgi:hypothetical protein
MRLPATQRFNVAAQGVCDGRDGAPDQQCNDNRERYIFAGATLEGGIDGKRF